MASRLSKPRPNSPPLASGFSDEGGAYRELVEHVAGQPEAMAKPPAI
jgi:hypothetical protein